MPVINKIANIIASGDFKSRTDHEYYDTIFKQTNVLILNKKTIYNDIVNFIDWWNK